MAASAYSFGRLISEFVSSIFLMLSNLNCTNFKHHLRRYKYFTCILVNKSESNSIT